MDIKFTGKYKSITAFEWLNIPKFAVITGPNGTGKSQLLKLIYNTIINNPQEREKGTMENETLERHEISFIQSEWELQNTTGTSVLNIIEQQNKYYDLFKEYNKYNFMFLGKKEIDLEKIKLYAIFSDIHKKIGKPTSEISQEEFNKILPEFFIENEILLTKKIEQMFSNYRLSEIDLIVQGKTENEIMDEIGQKPWIVLKEILQESKLLFSFNNPSQYGTRDKFTLKVQHEITGDFINFNDLSSGEEVLISLVFYLYNTQEKMYFLNSYY